MPLSHADIVLLGCGIHNLVIADRIAQNLKHIKVLAIDVNFKPGGCLAPISTIAGSVSLVPVVSIERSSDIQAEIEILKDGDFERKFAGYEDPNNFQRLWFSEWVHAFQLGKVKIELNPTRNFYRHSIPRILANISFISLNSRSIKLSNGIVIRYHLALSTWPLDIILSKIIDLPRDCAELLTHLKAVSTHITIVVEKLDKEVENLVKLYLHGTRASRTHTFLKVFLGTHAIVYAYTSFSRRYPPLPGMIEKIFSELKRFKIVDMKKVVDEKHGVVTYSAISRVDRELVRKCTYTLESYGFLLCERLGIWRDSSLSDIISSAASNYQKVLNYVIEIE